MSGPLSMDSRVVVAQAMMYPESALVVLGLNELDLGLTQDIILGLVEEDQRDVQVVIGKNGGCSV